MSFEKGDEVSHEHLSVTGKVMGSTSNGRVLVLYSGDTIATPSHPNSLTIIRKAKRR